MTGVYYLRVDETFQSFIFFQSFREFCLRYRATFFSFRKLLKVSDLYSFQICGDTVLSKFQLFSQFLQVSKILSKVHDSFQSFGDSVQSSWFLSKFWRFSPKFSFKVLWLFSEWQRFFLSFKCQWKSIIFGRTCVHCLALCNRLYCKKFENLAQKKLKFQTTVLHGTLRICLFTKNVHVL